LDVSAATLKTVSARVESGAAKSAKVPGALSSRKDGVCAQRAWDIESLALVVSEEEVFVHDNPTAESTAKHIPAHFVLRKRIPSLSIVRRIKII